MIMYYNHNIVDIYIYPLVYCYIAMKNHHL